MPIHRIAIRQNHDLSGVDCERKRRGLIVREILYVHTVARKAVLIALVKF
jgi:hypothetical protein